jgi:hypothetical protein
MGEAQQENRGFDSCTSPSARNTLFARSEALKQFFGSADAFKTMSDISDIEQVLREKKSFTLRCMLDGIKELQGRVAQWNRFASNVSIT